MRGATLAATLAAIGRVSRAGCADWASEGSDAARSGQEGYGRLGMLSDRCCGAAVGHPPESGVGVRGGIMITVERHLRAATTRDGSDAGRVCLGRTAAVSWLPVTWVILQKLSCCTLSKNGLRLFHLFYAQSHNA